LRPVKHLLENSSFTLRSNPSQAKIGTTSPGAKSDPIFNRVVHKWRNGLWGEFSNKGSKISKIALRHLWTTPKGNFWTKTPNGIHYNLVLNPLSTTSDREKEKWKSRRIERENSHLIIFHYYFFSIIDTLNSLDIRPREEDNEQDDEEQGKLKLNWNFLYAVKMQQNTLISNVNK
jgi:hypothetical protein